VSAPGSLRVVERTIPEPGPGQVRIRVDACGICHTDAATVMGGPLFLDTKWLAALRLWVAQCPDGKSVKGLVSG
jgi:NADPH:quinone reductase-like Zn-dependent oxidoreductase